MAPSSEAPRDLADRVIRQELQHPANLRAFLHQAVPALAGGFDCERGRLVEREFPLDDWGRREADLPFEVPYRLGDDELWALVYVLIEHQPSFRSGAWLSDPQRIKNRTVFAQSYPAAGPRPHPSR
jgi:hypothetical protein